LFALILFATDRQVVLNIGETLGSLESSIPRVWALLDVAFLVRQVLVFFVELQLHLRVFLVEIGDAFGNAQGRRDSFVHHAVPVNSLQKWMLLNFNDSSSGAQSLLRVFLKQAFHERNT